MPISVVCPGCHKRFKVSDKFAGQKGPCPQCKAIIQIPTLQEEVVVHAPEVSGPKDSAGRAVLKPIFRQETKFSPVALAAVAGSAAVVFLVALMLRATFPGNPPVVMLVLGAALLGPATAYGGYWFLRDDELEPYRGQEAAVRTLICGGVFALLWGVVAFFQVYVLDGDPWTGPAMYIILPAMVGVGGAASHLALDLDYLTGVLHYGFYFVVCVLLRLTMGLDWFAGAFT